VTRYITRAAKPLFVETPLWDDVEPHRPSIVVDDSKEVDTGLVDASGYAIYRLQEPVGFGRDNER
jgi:hypothetical protein